MVGVNRKISLESIYHTLEVRIEREVKNWIKRYKKEIKKILNIKHL